MPTFEDFNAVSRAKAELQLFQSNIIAELEDGSRLRAIWEGCRFVDFSLGEPMETVRDFWVDHTLPVGGFAPQ